MEIVGIGYAKELKPGESYLQIEVVNIWDSPPIGAFTFYEGSSVYYLTKRSCINQDENEYRVVTESNVTKEIVDKMAERGYNVKLSHFYGMILPIKDKNGVNIKIGDKLNITFGRQANRFKHEGVKVYFDVERLQVCVKGGNLKTSTIPTTLTAYVLPEYEIISHG